MISLETRGDARRIAGTVENDVLAWVELILGAVLNRQDASPLVDLATRAGIDLDMLQYFANVTLDSVRDHMMAAAGIVSLLSQGQIEPHFTAADVEALKELGITDVP